MQDASDPGRVNLPCRGDLTPLPPSFKLLVFMALAGSNRKYMITKLVIGKVLICKELSDTRSR